MNSLNTLSHLGLLAEIAAVYSGFIAVFLVFSGNDGKFVESDKHFIQAMVLGSVLVITAGLAPRLLLYFYDESAVWQVSTWSVIALATLMMIFVARDQLAMSADEAKKVPWYLHFVSWAIGIVAMICLVAGLATAYTAGFYVAAVSLGLLNVIWCFVVIVFRKFF